MAKEGASDRPISTPVPARTSTSTGPPVVQLRCQITEHGAAPPAAGPPRLQQLGGARARPKPHPADRRPRAGRVRSGLGSQLGHPDRRGLVGGDTGVVSKRTLVMISTPRDESNGGRVEAPGGHTSRTTTPPVPQPEPDAATSHGGGDQPLLSGRGSSAERLSATTGFPVSSFELLGEHHDYAAGAVDIGELVHVSRFRVAAQPVQPCFAAISEASSMSSIAPGEGGGLGGRDAQPTPYRRAATTSTMSRKTEAHGPQLRGRWV
jgi:hypothetical protein